MNEQELFMITIKKLAEEIIGYFRLMELNPNQYIFNLGRHILCYKDIYNLSIGNIDDKKDWYEISKTLFTTGLIITDILQATLSITRLSTGNFRSIYITLPVTNLEYRAIKRLRDSLIV